MPSDNKEFTVAEIITLLSLVPSDAVSYQVLGSAAKQIDVGEHKSDITFSTQAIKAGDNKTLHGFIVWVEDEPLQKAHLTYNEGKENA